MSESTKTPALIATPEKLSAAMARVVATLNREGYNEALRSNTLSKYGEQVAGLHSEFIRQGANIEGGKTVAGAYVHRAMTESGATPGEIKDRLAVSSSSVTRYGYIARLHFDFDFTPADPEWTTLVNKLVTNSEFTRVLKSKDCQRADILRKYSEIVNPPAAVGGSDAGTSTNGTQASGATGASLATAKDLQLPRSNSEILKVIARAIAALSATDSTLNSSPKEWAMLSELNDSISALLLSAPDATRTAGLAAQAKAQTASKSTQESASK